MYKSYLNFQSVDFSIAAILCKHHIVLHVDKRKRPSLKHGEHANFFFS
jgi:hypothetical protein